MLIQNDTPFAAMGFGQLHRDGVPMAVICVRATYSLALDGVLLQTNDQQIVLADVYEENPNRSPLIRVGDLIPYKPAADVTLVGTAFAPCGRASTHWEVALAVGQHALRLRAHGPRQWEPRLNLLKPSWKLGASKPVTSVAIDYRNSAGGRFVGDPDGRGDPRNLIGPGILHNDWSRIGKPFRAPQIDSVRAPVKDPFALIEPQGFGPIPPFWSWRQRHAGTYDELWQAADERRLPHDFNYQFYQTAHPDLILPHLLGDEEVKLDGLIPDGRKMIFILPGVVPVAHHAWSDGRRVFARLTLDGLHIDVRRSVGPWRVDLTWRGWVPACPAYIGAALLLSKIDDAASLPSSDERGLVEKERVA